MPFISRNETGAGPMFPASSPTASSSASVAFDEASSTSTPSVTFDASTIVVLLAFIVFTLFTVAIFLFAPTWRRRFNEMRAKRRNAKQQKAQIQGLGFGFDGLTQAEFKEFRWKEDQDGWRSFMRLPRHPPSLCVITPLPPITIPAQHKQADDEVGMTLAHDRTDSDPVPEYEQGDHLADSKFEDIKY